MNALETLQTRLRERFPSLESTLDPGESGTASWYLDVRLGNHSIVIEWRPGFGFGVTSGHEASYGAGPDERFDEPDETFRRVVLLLLAGAVTRSSTSVTQGTRTIGRGEVIYRLVVAFRRPDGGRISWMILDSKRPRKRRFKRLDKVIRELQKVLR